MMGLMTLEHGQHAPPCATLQQGKAQANRTCPVSPVH
jgi:hypothetical protein